MAAPSGVSTGSSLPTFSGGTEPGIGRTLERLIEHGFRQLEELLKASRSDEQVVMRSVDSIDQGRM